MRRPLLAHYGFHDRPAWSRGPWKVAHDDTLEFNLVVSGYEHSILEHSTEKVFTRGRYELIEPFRQHSSWTEQKPVAFHNVHFFASEVAELADSIGIKRLSWPLHTQKAPAMLRRLLDSLGREASDGKGVPGHDVVMESLVAQLAVTLLRAHHGTPTRQHAIIHASATLAKLRRAADRMRDDCGAAFSLEVLASEAGMSRFHFLREFKKAFGSTPHAFLLQQRLERAATLLRQGERTITEIALDTGFGSSSQFSTHFKRRFGVSPSAWARRRGRS